MATGQQNDYVNKGETGLLYIEPKKEPLTKPLIDAYTRKMTAAFRQAKVNYERSCFGFHSCECRVESEPHTYELGNGLVTNSLCIHYLAFHREEVPDYDLKNVESLKFGEEEPNEEELNTPEKPVKVMTREEWLEKEQR